MDTTLIFVHGTFSSVDTWVPRFTDKLAELVGEKPEIHLFRWSGRNRVGAREEAAREFAATAARLHGEAPSARRIVICHSHGGSVVMGALAREPELPIDALVCIGTPFIHVDRPSEVLPGIKPPLKPVAAVFGFLAVLGITRLLGVVGVDPFLRTASLMWMHPVATFAMVFAALTVYIGVGLLVFIKSATLTTEWDVMTDEEQMEDWRSSLLAEPMDEVWALKRRCRLPIAETVPTLLIKMPGDEAHGALAAAHLASWVIRVLYSAPLRVIGVFDRDPEDVGLLGLPLFVVTWLTGLVYRSIVSLPIIVLTAAALLPFGIEFSRLAGRILVAVGDAPPGDWRITYLPPFDRYQERLKDIERYQKCDLNIASQLESLERELNEQWTDSTRRITHSRAHNDLRSARVVADWLRALTPMRDPARLNLVAFGSNPKA